MLDTFGMSASEAALLNYSVTVATTLLLLTTLGMRERTLPSACG